MVSGTGEEVYLAKVSRPETIRGEEYVTLDLDRPFRYRIDDSPQIWTMQRFDMQQKHVKAAGLSKKDDGRLKVPSSSMRVFVARMRSDVYTGIGFDNITSSPKRLLKTVEIAD